MEYTQDAAESCVLITDDADSAVSVDELDSVPASSSSETLEELVDQMEIQISDHEGEESLGEGEGSAAEEDGVVLSGHVTMGGGVGEGPPREGEEEEVVMSEKISTSTRLGTGHRGSGELERGGAAVGVALGGRKRKASSTHDKTEFPGISLSKQLSNEDIVELMGLLQVRVGKAKE